MGRYITIEGQDGTGKTTLHKTLKKRIGRDITHCDRFLFIKEPYYRESINLLKTTTHPLGRLGVFLLDRTHLMEEVILPAIQQGVTVVSDRSYISCEVYQYLQMREKYPDLPESQLDLMNTLMALRPREFPKISYIICLSAPVAILKERILNRGDGDRVDEDYLMLLRKTYIDHVIRQRCGYTILDSSQYSKAELVEEALDILIPPVGKK